MYWLYLLLALACLFGAYQLTGWVVVLLLLMALAGLVAWVFGWATSQAARSGGGSRILQPEDLRRLREQSDARKAAAQANPPAN